MDKNSVLKVYKQMREKLGKQPSAKEFYTHSKIPRRLLIRIYGRKAYNKLVSDYGDSPKSFLRAKSDLDEILKEYGLFIRRLQYIPIEEEWNIAGFKPTSNGIRKSHNLRWSQLSKKFIEIYGSNEELADVVKILSSQVEKPEQQIEPIDEKVCFVYLMLDKHTMLYKIGISNSAEYREKTLQSEQPRISLIAKKEYPNRRIAGSIEQALHSTYEHRRKRGEWFLLDEGDVNELIQTLDD